MRACRRHSEWLDLLWDVHTPFASRGCSRCVTLCCVSMYLALCKHVSEAHSTASNAELAAVGWSRCSAAGCNKSFAFADHLVGTARNYVKSSLYCHFTQTTAPGASGNDAHRTLRDQHGGQPKSLFASVVSQCHLLAPEGSVGKVSSERVMRDLQRVQAQRRR